MGASKKRMRRRKRERNKKNGATQSPIGIISSRVNDKRKNKRLQTRLK